MTARRIPGYAAMAAALATPGAAAAQEPRPLTFNEVLAAVASANPTAAAAARRAEAAEGAYISSRGIFDPTYLASAYWRTERQYQFLPYEFRSVQRSWDLLNGIAGVTGTGTTYSLTGGLSYFYTDTTAAQNTAEQGLPGTDVTDLNTTTDAYTTRVDATITQQLLRGSRLAYTLQSVREARAERDVAELVAQAESQRAMRETAAAYWLWTLEEGVAGIEADARAIAEEDLRVAQIQVERGTLASAELARRRAQVSLTQTTALAARLRAEAAEDVVQAAMGEDPGIDRTPATQPGEAMAISLDPARVLEAALANNPDLLAARSLSDARQLTVAGAKAGKMVGLSATVQAGVAAQDVLPSSSAEGLLQEDNLPYLRVGADLFVPLGNRAARGEADRATSEAAAAASEADAIRLDLQRQVATELRNLEVAQSRVRSADDRVAALTEALQAEESALARGGSHPEIVLAQRRELTLARVEALRARTDWRTAEAALLALQGQLQP